MPDGQKKKCAHCVCLILLAAGCAQGGADSGFDWSIPGDIESEASSGGDYDDASALGALSLVPSSAPTTPSVASPSGQTVASAQSADAGILSPEPEGALDPEGELDDGSPGDAFSGDASIDDAPEEEASWQDAASGASPDSVVYVPAVLGDLLITEVMFAPFGPRPEAEWFEVYNTGGSPALLSGLTIIDGSMHAHTIASDIPVVAPVRAYVLLVRDRATAIANGVPAAAIVYDYGAGLSRDQGVQLDDGSDGAVSLWNEGLELTGAPYGSWGLLALGQSVELSTLQLVGSDLAESWCYAEYPWALGSDYGTPGAANDCWSGASP
jgi:hypothetical protein